MKALTVRQPWAWLILNAGKDIENRDWQTNLRGRVAIHAAKSRSLREFDAACDFIEQRGLRIPIPYADQPAYGYVLGTVEIVDCVIVSASPWFAGKYGFVLRDPEPFSVPIEAKGALGFWDWKEAGA